MKENRSSETAEGVAAYRALETMRPKSERVIDDPYAKLFLGKKWKKMITSPVHSWLVKIIGNFKYPGFFGSLIARVRFMNECLKECFPADHTQLVILGAGYDMSAYGFHDILRNANIFEVDYPGTQKEKLTKIQIHLKSIPENITYVPHDFETDDLNASLTRAGYSPSEKTLFIWEGVIYFLEKESVEKTLGFIVDHSAKGSSVAFDYFPPEVISGATNDRLGKEMNKFAQKNGEPYKFGIEPDDIDGFLKHHGFKHIFKSSTDEVRNSYFHGDNKHRKVSTLFNFVRATT